jgi:hypothetical protein
LVSTADSVSIFRNQRSTVFKNVWSAQQILSAFFAIREVQSLKMFGQHGKFFAIREAQSLKMFGQHRDKVV